MEPQPVMSIHTYSSIFNKPSGLPLTRAQDHSVPLLEYANLLKWNHIGILSQKEQIEKKDREMLEEGIIKPSKSPFSSPLLLVREKDGSWWFCTDYRTLNAVTIKDSFLIPMVDELIDELHGTSYFSKLELRSSYHEIFVDFLDWYKTSFRTHHGHYEWLVMPFGLKMAPTTFQQLMNEVFKSYLRKFVLVFL